MDDDFGPLIVFMIFVCFFAWVTSNTGARMADENMKQQAVDAGKAEWVVDQKSGDTRFSWKK